MQAITQAILTPQRPPYSTLEFGPREFELKGEVYHRSDFHVVNGRGLKLKGSLFRSSQLTPLCVLYCHGNCGNRLDSLEVLESALPKGLSFCSFDFSGAGHSEGRFTSFGFFEQDDISTILSYLRNEGIGEVILWGRSMGAVAALMYASRHAGVRAVIADSPFASMKELLRDVIHSYIRLPDFLTNYLISRLQRSILTTGNFDIE